jgi:hypothetical protein
VLYRVYAKAMTAQEVAAAEMNWSTLWKTSLEVRLNQSREPTTGSIFELRPQVIRASCSFAAGRQPAQAARKGFTGGNASRPSPEADPSRRLRAAMQQALGLTRDSASGAWDRKSQKPECLILGVGRRAPAR